MIEHDLITRQLIWEASQQKPGIKIIDPSLIEKRESNATDNILQTLSEIKKLGFYIQNYVYDEPLKVRPDLFENLQYEIQTAKSLGLGNLEIHGAFLVGKLNSAALFEDEESQNVFSEQLNFLIETGSSH